MQAIISDIIVSQAAQSGGLQISNTYNNNSSNTVSFADMLASLQKSENSQEPQKSEPAEPVKKDELVEKTEETEKSDKVSDSQKVKQEEPEDKTDSKKPVAKDKTALQVKADEKSDKPVVKNEPVVNEKSEKVKPEKALNQDQKKTLLDRQKLESLIKESSEQNQEEQNSVVSSTAPQLALEVKNEAGLIQENLKTKDEKLIQNISEVQTEDFAENLDLITDAKTKVDFTEAEPKEKISVIDLRTKQSEEPEMPEQPQEKPQKSNLKIELNSGNTATVTMELEPQQLIAGENILSLDNQTAAANGSDFQAMVSNQIQANIPDFVRTGTILLKDNDKGTINLVLHPDDLGNVKIHLSMDGKTISAHITVNTKEALEVFKDNAQTLREAFAKNGYETANFDVSYNGSSNGQNQNQNFEGRYDGMEYIARNVYSDAAGVQTDGYIQNGWENGKNSEYSINIVA